MDKEKFSKDYSEVLETEAKAKAVLLESKRLLDECWALKYLEYSTYTDTDGKKPSEKKIEVYITTDKQYIATQKSYQEVYLQIHLISAKVKALEAILHLELKEPYKGL